VALLTGSETAPLIGIQPKTLETWRWRGFGPPFIKIGHLVRYRKEDVLAWLEAQTRRNTTESSTFATPKRASCTNHEGA
jgi:predicted DNA-binding transcriptional regulator AlpA